MSHDFNMVMGILQIMFTKYAISIRIHVEPIYSSILDGTLKF